MLEVIQRFDENLSQKCNKSALLSIQHEFNQLYITKDELHDIEAEINGIDGRFERFEVSHKENSKLMKETLNEYIDTTMDCLLTYRLN